MLKKFVLIFLLLLTHLLSAKEPFFDQGNQYGYDNNLTKEACAKSKKRLQRDLADIDANLHYGQCALHEGDIDAAMAAFDRADILDEENYMVHKCIGDMHAKIGNYELANMAYDKADQFCATPVMRASMFSKHPHVFTFWLDGRRGYDDNVKLFGSIADLNDWFGTVIVPTDRFDDQFTKVSLGFNHLYDYDLASPWYYKSRVDIINKNFDRFHEDDLIQILMQTGPGWSAKDYDLWIPASFTTLGIDYLAYSENLALKPKLYKQLNPDLLLEVEAAYSHTNYLRFTQGDHFALGCEFSLSQSYYLNDFRLGYRYLNTQKDDPDSPNLFIDNEYNQISLSYIRPLSKKISLGLDLSYRYTAYTDFISQEAIKRRYDILNQYMVHLSYDITESVRFVVDYFYYHNETNYIPEQYAQNIISVGINFHR